LNNSVDELRKWKYVSSGSESSADYFRQRPETDSSRPTDNSDRRYE
jgi:hypothetical protein